MINVFGSKVGQEEVDQVSDSIANQWMGLKVKAFENEMVERLHTDRFLLLDSSSNGLYMVVKLLNLPTFSEVILPFFGMCACFCRCGYGYTESYGGNCTLRILLQESDKDSLKS